MIHGAVPIAHDPKDVKFFTRDGGEGPDSGCGVRGCCAYTCRSWLLCIHVSCRSWLLCIHLSRVPRGKECTFALLACGFYSDGTPCLLAVFVVVLHRELVVVKLFLGPWLISSHLVGCVTSRVRCDLCLFADRVFIHPASVNFTQYHFESPWLVYVQMMEVSGRSGTCLLCLCSLFDTIGRMSTIRVHWK